MDTTQTIDLEELLKGAVARAVHMAAPSWAATSEPPEDPGRIAALAYVEWPRETDMAGVLAAMIADFRRRVAAQGRTPADFAAPRIWPRSSVPVAAYFAAEIDGIPVRWVMSYQHIRAAFLITVDARLLTPRPTEEP